MSCSPRAALRGRRGHRGSPRSPRSKKLYRMPKKKYACAAPPPRVTDDTCRTVSNSWCVSGGASVFPFIQHHRRVSGEQNHDVQTKDGVNP